MPAPPGIEPPDEAKSDLLSAVIEVAEIEMAEWGTGGLGIHLCCAAFSGSPCVRPKDLAENSPLSTAQIRRRLEELRAKGLVERGLVDGNVCYWAKREHAERLWRETAKRLSLQNATGVSYTKQAD